MKVVLLLLLGVSAFAEPVQQTENEHTTSLKFKITDKAVLEKANDILRILKYVNQPSYYDDFVDIAKSYSPQEEQVDKFSNEQAFKQFLHHYQEGFVPRGLLFSVFNEQHLVQAIALFKLFYYAKDYETFYKTAVWARQHVNEGLFLYSFSLAVKHRPDTYQTILPPIYEVYPYYFVNSQVIHKAQKYKQLFYSQQHTEKAVYTIYANYTDSAEHSLSYFFEDVGLNAYYYYYNMYYPFWFGAEEFKMKIERRGELYYYIHQQLLARYYLERLSNYEGDIPLYDYDRIVETGYYPNLQYPNGVTFPYRPNVNQQKKTHRQSLRYDDNNNNYYNVVENLERRIIDAIDAGFIYTQKGERIDIYTPEGFNVLGNIIESNRDSPNNRFYGYLPIFVRQLLSYNNQYSTNKGFNVVPSAVEHFETCLRDPAYWQFYKRIVSYFQKYKSQIPKYSLNELNFPGVKIENVQVDRLVTYFDHFDLDITSSVYVNKEEFENDAFQVKARQQRLNHRPFSYSINVTSDKEQQVVVRAFIGPPKFDQYGGSRIGDINDNRLNFFQIDAFSSKINVGKNILNRNSHQFYFGQDRTTYNYLFEKVTNAINGSEQFETDYTEFFFGFPQRLILPKGQSGGQLLQLYFIITPNKVPISQDNVFKGGLLKMGSGNEFIDSLPLGYPFDRVIDERIFFSIPNALFKDVLIYHKNASTINLSTSPFSENEPINSLIKQM